MTTNLEELEDSILSLDTGQLIELLSSIENEITGTNLFVSIEDYKDLQSELRWKERECDSLESENDNYQKDISDLEQEIGELEIIKDQLPINSLKDELKLDFIKQIWEKYELEQLEEIFMWDPVKGIQK